MGGIPGTFSTLAALLKALIFELICILHVTATILNNDAMAYCNHVLPSLLILYHMQLDLPSKAAALMVDFLKTVRYHVKHTIDELMTFITISFKSFTEFCRVLVPLLQFCLVISPYWLKYSIKIQWVWYSRSNQNVMPSKIIDMFVNIYNFWNITSHVIHTAMFLILIK